jgi:hypothetical protein
LKAVADGQDRALGQAPRAVPGKQELRAAERVVFIGYSLADDDVEVVYLIKRSVAHLGPSQISVVEYSAYGQDVALVDHPVGRRYRALFGDNVQWYARGLDACLGDGAAPPQVARGGATAADRGPIAGQPVAPRSAPRPLSSAFHCWPD